MGLKSFLLIAIAVALSACTTGGQAILKNIEGCERHYNGVFAASLLGGQNFSGSAKIDCDPKFAPAPVVAVEPVEP